jgi:peptidoglycan/LPS O-acetylase OafA/YrhL
MFLNQSEVSGLVQKHAATINQMCLKWAYVSIQSLITSSTQVLQQACESANPPDIVFVQLGLGESTWFQYMDMEAMVQAVWQALQPASCARSLTLVTPFHVMEHWTAEIDNLARRRDLMTAVVTKISRQFRFPEGCPKMDFLDLSGPHIYDYIHDYPHDPVHFCINAAFKPLPRCKTGERAGSKLAAAMSQKLHELVMPLHTERYDRNSSNNTVSVEISVEPAPGSTTRTRDSQEDSFGVQRKLLTSNGCPSKVSIRHQHGAPTRGTNTGHRSGTNTGHQHRAPTMHGRHATIAAEPAAGSNSTNCRNGSANDTNCTVATAPVCDWGLEAPCRNSLWVLVGAFMAIFSISQLLLLPLTKKQEPSYQALKSNEKMTEENRSTSKARLEGIDGARLLGALHICTFHVFSPGCAGSWYCEFWEVGKLWVHYFFVVTGFVIARSAAAHANCCSDPSLLDLLKKRLKPLYPLYSVALILDPRTYQLATSLWGISQLVLYVSMVQTWLPPFASDPPNGPGWFLSCLFVFWPLLALWAPFLVQASRVSLFAILVGCLVLAVAPDLVALACGLDLVKGSWFGYSTHHFLAFSPITNWHFVLAGAALGALFRPRQGEATAMETTVIVITGLAAVLFAVVGGVFLSQRPLLLDRGFFTLPFWIWLVARLADETSWPSLLMAPLAGGAAFSYSLYILHVPLLNLFDLLLSLPPWDLPLETWWMKTARLAVAALVAWGVQTAVNGTLAAFAKVPNDDNVQRALQRVSIKPDLEPSLEKTEPDQEPLLSARTLQRISMEPDLEPSLRKIVQRAYHMFSIERVSI